MSEVESVLRRAFGDEVREEHLARFYNLPADRRAEAVRRLEAVLDAEQAKTTADMDRIAEAAGLKRSSLFRLRQRWRSEDRSLDIVIPWATRTAPVRREASASKQVLHTARRMLLKDSSRSNGEIAREIAGKLKSTMAHTSLVKLVQQARREGALDPAMLAEAYGRTILIDVCALDLIVQENGRDFVPVGIFIVERASGLVLALELCRPEDAVHLYGQAITTAAQFIADEVIDREPGNHPLSAIRMTVPEPGRCAVDVAALEQAEALQGLDVKARASGRRRFGELLRSNLGQSLGHLRFFADWHEESVPLLARRTGRVLDWSGAKALARSELRAHNDEILALLRSGKLAEAIHSKEGVMRSALSQFASAWASAVVRN